MLEISKPFDEFKVRLSDEWAMHLSKSMWHWSNGRNGHGQLCHLSKTNMKNQEVSKKYWNSVIFIILTPSFKIFIWYTLVRFKWGLQKIRTLAFSAKRGSPKNQDSHDFAKQALSKKSGLFLLDRRSRDKIKYDSKTRG